MVAVKRTERTSRLSLESVPIDKGPVDLEAKAGAVAEMQMTAA